MNRNILALVSRHMCRYIAIQPHVVSSKVSRYLGRDTIRVSRSHVSRCIDASMHRYTPTRHRHSHRLCRYGTAKPRYPPFLNSLTNSILYIFSVRICESPDSISMTMPNPSDTFKPDRSKYCKGQGTASFHDHVHAYGTDTQLM